MALKVHFAKHRRVARGALTMVAQMGPIRRIHGLRGADGCPLHNEQPKQLRPQR